MKRIIAIIMAAIYVLIYTHCVVAAEQENLFTFDTVSNNKTYNQNTTISSALLYGETSLASGISSNSLYFNGVDSYVKLPQENKVQGLNSFSISFWMKPDMVNTNTFAPILYCKDIFELRTDNNTRKLSVMLHTSAPTKLYSAYNFEEDKWHYIAITYNGSKLCLYVNGKLDSNVDATGTIKSSDAPTYLATDETSYYKGNIDEMSFYKSALSESTITEIYHKYMDVITDWDYISYPLKSSYQHGISAVSSDLFKNSKIFKPIYTGFEERNEINAINTNNKDGQLEVTESKYTGKFALKIKKTTEGILPIQETGYFKTTEEEFDSTTQLPENNAGVNIVIKNKTVTISGTRHPEEMLSIIVKKGDTIAYLDQLTADLNGCFKFAFGLKDFGNYTARISGAKSGSHVTSFSISESNNELPNIEKTEEVNVKCNSYNLMIKPMYKSETISFYVKSYVQDENSNQKEEYVLIKSDNDRDGIFKVGEDLSRGKWQKVELDLLDIDTDFQGKVVSGLYIDANIGSEWLFDDINSEYKKINKVDMPLSQFAKENVVYKENTLQFAKSEENAAFNNNESVISGGIDVSQRISEINVDSGIVYTAADDNLEIKEDRKVLFNEPISSSAWIVNDTDYDTLETGVGQKTGKLYHRETLPTVGYKSMTIHLGENESMFRLKVKAGSTSGKYIDITDKNGTSTRYYLSSTAIFTEWYDADITIVPHSSYSISDVLKILEIEYYEKEPSTEQNLVLKNSGIATLDLNEFSTSDRSKLTIEAFMIDAENSGSIRLNLRDKDNNIYYQKRFDISLAHDAINISDIIPKIKKQSKLEIINYFSEYDGNRKDEIIISDLKLESVINSDWNLEEKNKYYISNKTYFYNTVGQDTSQAGLEGKWASEVAEEGEIYAFTHPNIGGIVNTSLIDQTLTLDGTASVILRIINLDATDAYIKYSNKSAFRLNYGECDYLISTPYNIIIPPNPKIIIVSATYINKNLTNPNNLTYTTIEGLSSSYDVSTDGNKIFYANINDKNALYSYDFISKEYKKISDVAANLIVVSPDEKLAAIKKVDGTCSLLNLVTQEETSIPSTSDVQNFYFSPQNELFVYTESIEEAGIYLRITSVLNIFQGNTLVEIEKEVKTVSSMPSKTRIMSFDSTGNYIYVNMSKKLYKKTGGVWNEIKTIETGSVLSNDATTIFGRIITDVNTGMSESLPEGFEFVSKTSDDHLLLQKAGSATGKYYYYLYNPITGENNKILDYEVNAFENKEFYSDSNLFMAFLPGGMVVRRYFDTEKPQVKYALSFDGMNNWHTYTGGRWKLISKSNTPSIKEMQTYGMTEEEINSIPTNAYDKLYEEGNSVLTVDFAIYMNSPFNNQSPTVESIMISTQNDDDTNGFYGIHMQKYEKSEYRTVSSVFPIENFTSNAECYYLLYIGNEWLYTYKDNKLVKTVESADELLSDIESSWITFKQYGMTSKELRSVPSDVINNLFVNDNYANSEFGIIYVVKTDSDEIDKFTVDFKLKSESNFITEDDIVIEIAMSSGEVIVVDSNEFSKTEIENLLSWIEGRQNGVGTIFYRIINNKKQHFINYYMINSINVYNGTDYRESHSQTQEIAE